MKKKQVDFDLRFKIKNYLEYLFTSESADQQKNVDSLLKKLPESLRNEFLLQTNGKFLEDVKFLNKNFSGEFIKKLVHLMEQSYYSPGDKVYVGGDLYQF